MYYKICCGCGQRKSIDNFSILRKNMDGYSNTCKSCVRTSQRLHFYGLTIDGYNKIFNDQSGKCAICERHQSELSYPLCVDHDHETNKVRGLLCHKCNIGIGFLGDNIASIEKVLEYLKKIK